MTVDKDDLELSKRVTVINASDANQSKVAQSSSSSTSGNDDAIATSGSSTGKQSTRVLIGCGIPPPAVDVKVHLNTYTYNSE